MIALLMTAVLMSPPSEPAPPAAPGPRAPAAPQSPKPADPVPAEPRPKAGANSPQTPAPKAAADPGDDGHDGDVDGGYEEGLPPEVDWPALVISLLVHSCCWGLPTLFVLTLTARMALLTFAPEIAYRIRDRFARWGAERARQKAEVRDLETQLAGRDLPHLRYKLGRLCVLLGRPARAVELLPGVLAAEPGHIDAAYMLGRALLLSGRPADAIAPLQAAAANRESHDYGGLMVALGRAFAGAGRPADAEAALRRALVVSPDMPEALYVLGTVLAAQGRRDDARAAWRQCLHACDTGGTTFRRKNLEWLRRSRVRLWFG
jgi:hypothetical protein